MLYIIISLCVLESCDIYFPRNNEPIARVCFFDPSLKSILYKSKNGYGMKRIQIELVSDENNTTFVYFKKNYSNPIQSFDLSLMDTVLFMQNVLQIKIWDKSPVIEDYNLVIKASDWKQGKLVYSRYSIR